MKELKELLFALKSNESVVISTNEISYDITIKFKQLFNSINSVEYTNISNNKDIIDIHYLNNDMYQIIMYGNMDIKISDAIHKSCIFNILKQYNVININVDRKLSIYRNTNGFSIRDRTTNEFSYYKNENELINTLDKYEQEVYKRLSSTVILDDGLISI